MFLSCKIKISFTFAALFLIAPNVPCVGKNISNCAKVVRLFTYWFSFTKNLIAVLIL